MEGLDSVSHLYTATWRRPTGGAGGGSEEGGRAHDDRGWHHRGGEGPDNGNVYASMALTPPAAPHKEVGLAAAAKGLPEGMPPSHKIPKFNLTLHRGSNFPSCRDQWEGYVKAEGLECYSIAIQRVALSHAMETETLTYVRGLGIPDDHTNTQALDRLERSLRGNIKLKVERVTLRSRAQKHGETIDTYVTSLKELARFCRYEAKREEEEIELTFLAGLLNCTHAGLVLMEKDETTFAESVLKAMALESVERGISNMDARLSGAVRVDAIHRHQGYAAEDQRWPGPELSKDYMDIAVVHHSTYKKGGGAHGQNGQQGSNPATLGLRVSRAVTNPTGLGTVAPSRAENVATEGKLAILEWCAGNHPQTF